MELIIPVHRKMISTKPEEIDYAYTELLKISPNFTIAAAFGNVHGVYKTGNVKLTSDFKKAQEFIKKTQYQ